MWQRASPDSQVSRRSGTTALIVYALFVVYATTMPFHFTRDPEVLALKRSWVSWNPLHLGTGEPTPLSDLAGNVAFFLPVGLLGFGLFAGRRAWSAILLCAGMGLGLSLLVETLQFFTPARVPAISDILSNTIGTFVGAALAAWYRAHLSRLVEARARGWSSREPLVPVLVALVAVLTLRALVPLDVVTAVNVLKRSVRSARLDPWTDPVSPGSELATVLLFSLLATLAFVTLRRLLSRDAWSLILAVAGTSGLALTHELVQLFIRSRVSSVRDVLDGMAGGILGAGVAWAWVRARPRANAWFVATLVYALLLAFAALEPFHFRMPTWASRLELSKGAYVPYYTLYFKEPLDAVTQFLDDLLFYLPFGYLVAQQLARGVRPAGTARKRLWSKTALMCATWAFCLELLQIAVPGRYVDVSDTVTALLGGLLGAWAWSWLQELRPPPREHAQAVQTRQSQLVSLPLSRFESRSCR